MSEAKQAKTPIWGLAIGGTANSLAIVQSRYNSFEEASKRAEVLKHQLRNDWPSVAIFVVAL